MISLLAVASFAFQQGLVPLQFIPKAQLKFERKDTILESGAGETTAIVLVNDENVSNEVLEAISKNPESIRIVELTKKDSNGRLVFWTPAGKPIYDNTIEIPNAESVKMAPGEVVMIIENPLVVGYPKSPADKPGISSSIAGAKLSGTILSKDGKRYGLYKLGDIKFKFSNIRFSVQTRAFAGTFATASGTTKTISDVDFKVVGKMGDAADSLEHFEVLESGYVGMDNLILYGQFDWEAVEREVGPVKNKNEVIAGRLLRKQGEPVDPKEMHIDFPSKRPVKYLSSITVLRSSGIQGFFQHIATEPIG